MHLAQPVCVPFTLSFHSPFTKLHRKFALAPETYRTIGSPSDTPGYVNSHHFHFPLCRFCSFLKYPQLLGTAQISVEIFPPPSSLWSSYSHRHNPVGSSFNVHCISVQQLRGNASAPSFRDPWTKWWAFTLDPQEFKLWQSRSQTCRLF